MSVINTNYLSLVAQNNLQKSQSALGSAIERLSSGLRINSAKDDAAGQAIANRMTAQVNGLNQAARNANDGISLAQTAEGSLNQINDNLQRIRELTVQAQNGTNSASDIDSIQQEVNQRLEEIDRIARETDFNGTRVLDNDTDTNISIQVGAKDGQSIDIKISAQGGWNQYNATGTSVGEINGETRTVRALGFDVRGGDAGTVTATVDASSAAGVTNGTTVSFVSDNATGELLIKDVGLSTETGLDLSNQTGLSNASGNALSFVKSTSGQLFIKDEDTVTPGNTRYIAVTDDMVGAGGVITADLTANRLDAAAADALSAGTSAAAGNANTGESALVSSTNYYKVTTDMVGATGTITADLSGLQSVGAPAAETVQNGAAYVATISEEGDPLAQLDKALAAVDSQRSLLGAIQNRFQDAINNLQTNSTNLQAARSRIEDADYAVEVANMSKNQILQQAGTSVLAQANQIPQGVLSLLR